MRRTLGAAHLVAVRLLDSQHRVRSAFAVKLKSLVLPILAVLISALACGGRVFTETHLYSLVPADPDEVYDRGADELLAPNVWILRSDGTFDSWVVVDDQEIRLSGTYEGDDAGSGFFFQLDTNQDGVSDHRLYAGSSDTERFTFVEWTYGGLTIRYVLLGIYED